MIGAGSSKTDPSATIKGRGNAEEVTLEAPWLIWELSKGRTGRHWGFGLGKTKCRCTHMNARSHTHTNININTHKHAGT